MREILFRAKRKDNGEWIYGYYSTTTLGRCGSFHVAPVINEPFTEPFTGTWYEIDIETLCEYTGLKDKNGTKIFEGDICRNCKTGEIVSVKWHGTMAGFVWSKRKEKSYTKRKKQKE